MTNTIRWMFILAIIFMLELLLCIIFGPLCLVLA